MSKNKGFSETSASRYSLALFELAKENNLLSEVEDHSFAIINLIEAPKTTQIQIAGMQTNGAVPATNNVAIAKFSWLGKNAVAAVNATTHALGFIN